MHILLKILYPYSIDANSGNAQNPDPEPDRYHNFGGWSKFTKILYLHVLLCDKTHCQVKQSRQRPSSVILLQWHFSYANPYDTKRFCRFVQNCRPTVVCTLYTVCIIAALQCCDFITCMCTREPLYGDFRK